MELRFIDPNTEMTIMVSTYDNEIVRQYTAYFVEIATRVSLLVECESLYHETDLITNDVYFKISFYRDMRLYEFKGKFKKAYVEGSRYYIQIDQTAEIKEGTRRSAPRHDILTAVTIYESEEAYKYGRVLDTGQTVDISRDSLCFLTNTALNPRDKEHHYMLEFTIDKRNNFVLPARLVRVGNSPKSVQYRHDYGFIFDYTNQPDERSRLLTALFNHMMTGWEDEKTQNRA